MSNPDAEFAALATSLANAIQAVNALAAKVSEQEKTIARIEEGQRRLFGIVGSQFSKEAKPEGNAAEIVERMKSRLGGGRGGVAG